MPTDIRTDEIPPDDVARLFSALATRADRIPLGTAEAARRLGEHRRHRFVAICLALAVILASATGVLVLGSGRPRVATPAVPPIGPAHFIALREVGSLTMDPVDLDPVPPQAPRPAEARTVFTSIVIDNDTAYVARGAGGIPTLVGALDLTTGQPAFPTLDLGDWTQVREFTLVGDNLLLSGVAPGGPVIVVLNARTGIARWTRPVAADATLAGLSDALVIYAAGTLTAFDWTSGALLWSRSADAGRGLLQVQRAAPEGAQPLGSMPIDPTDQRLIAVSPRGTVDVIDVLTGLSRTTFSIENPEYLFAVGGTLYVGAAERLLSYPLAGPGTATLIASGVVRANYCGRDLICTLGSTGQFAAIDANTGTSVARLRLGAVATASGDGFLGPYGSVYDRSGAPISPDSGHLPVWWVGPGSVLTFDPVGPTAEQPVTVGGLSTTGASWTSLGQLPAVPVQRCGADRHYLVCAFRDGFRAWQFAAT
ncbi:MAG TPA: PQQ-binding-like beta-propeller repeat protein [Micromonosporaceae bacterium]|jgi:outer membrane protein assembly factor BamB